MTTYEAVTSKGVDAEGRPMRAHRVLLESPVERNGWLIGQEVDREGSRVGRLQIIDAQAVTRREPMVIDRTYGELVREEKINMTAKGQEMLNAAERRYQSGEFDTYAQALRAVVEQADGEPTIEGVTPPDPVQQAEARRERARLAKERRAAGEAWQALVREVGFDAAYAQTFGPHIVGRTPDGASLLSSTADADPLVIAAESSCPNCLRDGVDPCPICATYGAHDGFCEHGLAPDLWDDFLEMVDRGLITGNPCDHTFGKLADGSLLVCARDRSHTHGPDCDCDTESHESIEHLIGSFRAEQIDRTEEALGRLAEMVR